MKLLSLIFVSLAFAVMVETKPFFTTGQNDFSQIGDIFGWHIVFLWTLYSLYNFYFYSQIINAKFKLLGALVAGKKKSFNFDNSNSGSISSANSNSISDSHSNSISSNSIISGGESQSISSADNTNHIIESQNQGQAISSAQTSSLIAGPLQETGGFVNTQNSGQTPSEYQDNSGSPVSSFSGSVAQSQATSNSNLNADNNIDPCDDCQGSNPQTPIYITVLVPQGVAPIAYPYAIPYLNYIDANIPQINQNPQLNSQSVANSQATANSQSQGQFDIRTQPQIIDHSNGFGLNLGSESEANKASTLEVVPENSYLPPVDNIDNEHLRTQI